MLNQQLVIRAFFNTKSDAETAHSQLENIGVFGDVVSGTKDDPHPFKVIFADTTLNLAKNSLRRISTRSVLAQVFDPARPPELGWGEFKTVE